MESQVEDGGRRFRVEVAYARPDRQEVIELEVEHGCTALEAARRSGITRHFPEIDLEKASLGIFSKPLDGRVLPLPADYVLAPQDRVEIYRPLPVDPRDARMRRVRTSVGRVKGYKRQVGGL